MIEISQTKIFFADNRSQVKCMVAEFLQSNGFDMNGLSPLEYADQMFPAKGLVIFPLGSFEIHYVQDIDDATKAISEHCYEKCFVSNPIGGGTEKIGEQFVYSNRGGFTDYLVKDLLEKTSSKVFYTGKFETSQLRAIISAFVDPESPIIDEEMAEEHVDAFVNSGRLKHTSMHYDATHISELLADELRFQQKVKAQCGRRIFIPAP